MLSVLSCRILRCTPNVGHSIVSNVPFYLFFSVKHYDLPIINMCLSSCVMLYTPGMPLEKVTCPCGMGYWDIFMKRFIDGASVRKGKAAPKKDYEAKIQRSYSAEKYEAILRHQWIVHFLDCEIKAQMDAEETVKGRNDGSTLRLAMAELQEFSSGDYSGSRKRATSAGPLETSSRRHGGLISGEIPVNAPSSDMRRGSAAAIFPREQFSPQDTGERLKEDIKTVEAKPKGKKAARDGSKKLPTAASTGRSPPDSQSRHRSGQFTSARRHGESDSDEAPVDSVASGVRQLQTDERRRSGTDNRDDPGDRDNERSSQAGVTHHRRGSRHDSEEDRRPSIGKRQYHR